MQKILVLGAGMVAGPLVRHLLDDGFALTVTSLDLPEAERLVGGHPHGAARRVDLTDREAVSALVAGHDLTVSLLPFEFHPDVARLCLEHATPMVTCSYVSPAMQALDGAARAAGLTFLNEIGVDPGIDHMSAMRVIDAVRDRGGRITGFRSYCGGLPAPEANDNPFGYKFSWAPRGVLLASRNGAVYRERGRRVDVAPERLFRDMHLVPVAGVGDFEAYPNRDSLGYIDVYGLTDVETMYRGTLRNIGWCDTMFCFRRAGLLELDESDTQGKTWAELAAELLDAAPGEDLRAAAARRMGVTADSLPPRNLEWLGFFADEPVGLGRTSPLDALGRLMQRRLRYAPGERDMIVMQHVFTAAYPDGRRERIISRLVDFGTPEFSSMARTVSLPAALGAAMILRGELTAPGVVRPVTREIYGPVLDGLARLGITCEEEASPLAGAPDHATKER